MNSGLELHAVAPREQAGARTGAQYEYQYHQAAAEALSLIDGTNTECIYCEWHDDYVEETATRGSYAFNQVKTRQKSRGPWSLADFFGLGRRKKGAPRDVTTSDSIFARLWDHTIKFGDRCTRFVFVTDAGVDPELVQLLNDTRAANCPAELPPKSAATFVDLQRALVQAYPSADVPTLFWFLSRLYVKEGVGTAWDLPGCRILIANRISEASEVDLRLSEAKKIGADLVAAIRRRSQATLAALPQTTEELRATKGFVIDNLLGLLSLSTEGYRQLRAGGRESVRALSRLHRLCNRNNVPANIIPDLCRYKTGSAAWRISERDRLSELDYVALKAEAADLLRAHNTGLKFEDLVVQAESLAQKYGERLTSSVRLTGELVLGLIIELAVEAED